MKAFKKIAAFFAATLMTASMAVSVSASAAIYYTDPNKYPNTADTSWSSGNSYVRRKYNDTSIYVLNGDTQTNVSVYGRTSQYSAEYSVSTFNGSTIATTNLTLPANSQRLIRQFINEKGYPYAYISFYNGNTHGEWSPDSVSSYPTIN